MDEKIHPDQEAAVLAPDDKAVEIKKAFEAANEHRDYAVYTRLMDAALEAKAASLFPYFGDVGEGSVIVDAGSGTGKLAELASHEFRGASVFALDVSHELLEQAENNQALIKLVYGNAIEQNFADNSIDVKYYSTSGHEIESFGGPGSMEKAVKISLRELKPGGRLVIRDQAKPERTEPEYLQILSTAGLDQVPEGIAEDQIDYSLLSTKALFDRFAMEFGNGHSFDFEKVEIDGEEYLKISPEWGHEFYLRKDYTANWRQEIKEKYTYWSMSQGLEILKRAGYVNVRAIPDPNDYILKNRLEGKVALYEMTKDGLRPIPFPTTHI